MKTQQPGELIQQIAAAEDLLSKLSFRRLRRGERTTGKRTDGKWQM